MKKKIVALVLLTALLSTFMVGCTLFETDEYRDYHQVVANVTYDTGNGVLSNVLYKGEVVTYVNTYGSSYMSQLGMSVEEVVEYFYDNLTRQKLMVLYAQDYLQKNKLVAADFDTRFPTAADWNAFRDKDKIGAYRAYMTVDEFRYCVEKTNKQMQDNLQTYIDELEDEQDKNSGSEDDDKEEEDKDDTEYLEARSKKTASEDEESDEYEENEAIKSDADAVKYFADKYEVEIDASKIENAYFFNYIDNVVKSHRADEDKSVYDNMKSAVKKLRGKMTDIINYDYFLVNEMTNFIIDKYTKHIGKTPEVIDNVAAHVSLRYDKQIATDLKKYVKSSDYSTAVGNNTFTFAAPGKNDIQVKSILLSFSDTQSAAITNLASLYPDSEDMVKAYRDIIATGVGSEADKEMLQLYSKLGIKVNVSNPDYDADEDELKDAYTDATIEDKENAYANAAVDYLTVLYAMAEDIQSKVGKAMDAAKEMSDRDKYLVKEYASQQAFNDWINLVNDDPGMFTSDVYAVTPDGEASSYVEEYTVLARALAGAGVGATAVTERGDSVMTSGNVKYEGSTEILKAANGAYTIYKKNMTTTVGKEEDDKKSADVYTMVTANGAEISFIVNEFGIHIVMVASLPVDEAKGSLTEKVVPSENEDEDAEKEVTMTIKGKDYVHDYTVNIVYKKDEEGNEDKSVIEKIEVEVTTIEKYFSDMIEDELSLDLTSLKQSNLFADKEFASKFDKIYNQIIKGIK